MEKPIEHYWRARLNDLKEALEIRKKIFS